MLINRVSPKRFRSFCAAAFTTIFAVTSVRADIGKDIEKELGKAVSHELESTYGLVRDPLLSAYVESIGTRLAAVSGRTDLEYTFRILDSDDVNATAAPGGHVYINRGTLLFVKSEDELAAVLGHEVGHEAGKHSMKQFNAQLIGMLMLAGFRTIKSDTLSTVGGMAGGLAMLKFSRDEENDADRRGLKNAVATGYDGRQMVEFLRRLGDEEKSKPSKFETYFLTHPPIPERIRRVNEESGSKNTAANAVAMADGMVARGLTGQAMRAYQRAYELNPECGANIKLASLVPTKLHFNPTSSLPDAARKSALTSLLDLDREIASKRADWTTSDSKWTAHRKTTENTLDGAAQSLTEAGRYIGRYDTVQYKQFNRLAQSFEQATKMNSQLRVVRDTADAVFADMYFVRNTLAQSVDIGDAEAAAIVPKFIMDCSAILETLAKESPSVERSHADAEHGARALRTAADSLMNSYKMPLGFSGGQFEILDMQVISSGNDLKGGVIEAQKLISRVSTARVKSLMDRTVIALLHTDLQSGGIATIISRYLNLNSTDVKIALRDNETDGALRNLIDVAYAQAASRAAAKSALSNGQKSKPTKNDNKKPVPENVTILLQLMSKDIDNEIRAAVLH